MRTGNCFWRRVTGKGETTKHETKCILLVREIIQAQFQGMVLITKFKLGEYIIITQYLLILVEFCSRYFQLAPSIVDIGIIIPKKIDPVLPVVERNTVLRFGYDIQNPVLFIKTG